MWLNVSCYELLFEIVTFTNVILRYLPFLSSNVDLSVVVLHPKLVNERFYLVLFSILVCERPIVWGLTEQVKGFCLEMTCRLNDSCFENDWGPILLIFLF